MFPIPGVVEVHGTKINLLVKGVLVEQDSTTTLMGHIKVIGQVLLDDTFPSPKSQIPVVDAEPPLFGPPIGHVPVVTVLKIA